MNKKSFNPANDGAAIFNRLRCLICALRATTLTMERRAWFLDLCNEFRHLLTMAAPFSFADWQNNELANGADDFNEAQLFYLGVTVAAPSLHYEY